MAATTPRHQNFMQTHGDSNSQSGDDDFVKIPKRGSSRGSSCIEDAIHQSTISMLGDLFPQQYKNPSDDIKLRISKITTSSSNSSGLAAAGSPESPIKPA